MASKLDSTIASLAIVIADRDPPAMMQAGAVAAAGLKPKDLAKLPDRWYPELGAKAAGVPHLVDPWAHLWFEALAEILVQSARQGLPGLLVLMNRDDSTYHDYVLVRLLRLAAEGVETDAILAQIRARLATLHYTKTYTSVREVVNWTSIDPRPLELLRPMSDVVVPRSDGDTVGKYIVQFTGELPILEARKRECV